MAIEAQPPSSDQNFLMSTNSNINLSPLPPSLNAFDFQQQQPCFMQNMGFDQGFVSSSCSVSQPLFSNFSQSFAALLQKQGLDLDHYLLLQGDKLKQMLQQQRRQELAILLKNFEVKARALVKEKEEDIEKLTKKTRILEDYLKKAEEETGAWQRIAKEKEEIVVALTNVIEQIKANLCNLVPSITTAKNHEEGTDENDAESVCDSQELMDKNRGKTGEERENRGLRFVCRWCNVRSCCVVLLPCKHLCCCQICEAVLGLCPVCHCVKQGSIGILLA